MKPSDHERFGAGYRGRSTSRRSRRCRFLPELLEGRCLLATFTPHPVPSTDNPPQSITSGPDGNLWFTAGQSSGPSQIGSITPSGTVMIFPAPGNPQQIVTGADGNLWFALDHKIGEITTAGVLMTYTLPKGTYDASSNVVQVGDLVAGPNGNIWFTIPDTAMPAIGEITRSGQFSIFTSGLIDTPQQITEGPDGNLWFTYSKGSLGESPDGFGRITPTGIVTNFTAINNGTVPNGTITNSAEYDLCSGPDGDVWFVAHTTGPATIAIGKITPSGIITEYPLIPVASSNGGDASITAGGDGDLYVVHSGSSNITQVIPSPSGPPTFNVLVNPGGGSTPGTNEAITKGPDGNIWYTLQSPQAIVELVTGPPSPTPTPTPTPSPTPAPTPTPTPTPTTTTPISTSTPTPTSTSTPTPTQTQTQRLASPTINAVTTLHRRGRITSIALIFNTIDAATDLPTDPLDVASATDVSNYQLMAMVRVKRSRAIIVQPVALASATYSHVTLAASATYGPFEQVRLTLGRPIPQGVRMQLTVLSSSSAIKGVHGIPLDGDNDGQPGGNYVAYL